MATDNKVPHENPLASWYHQLHALSRAAEDSRKEAAKMRERGRAIRIEADALAKFSQLDINNRLSDRINCVRQWHGIINDAKAQLIKVMRNLADTKIQADHFLADLADAITVNVECLTHRDTRKGQDYVNDPVQEELKKEAHLQLELRDQLQRAIDDVVKHLGTMACARNELSLDLQDKECAVNIDIEQYNRNEKSGQIGYKPFFDRVAKGSLDIQTWDDLGREALQKNQNQIFRGIELYEILNDELHKAVNRLNNQSDQIAEKLRRRVFEDKTAIRELEYQMKPLEDEKIKLLHELKGWEQSKNAKIASLKLAQTRTESRLDRPGIENVSDAAYYGLLEESHTLKDVIDGIDEQIGKAREHIHLIEDRLAELCEAVHKKKVALFVDENVIGIRKRLEIPMPVGRPLCSLVPDGVLRKKTNFY